MMKPLDDKKAFLGIGWAFAVCLNKDGTITTAAYEEDIRQAIRIILGTNQGERVMRPRFGCRRTKRLSPPSARRKKLRQPRMPSTALAAFPASLARQPRNRNASRHPTPKPDRT